MNLFRKLVEWLVSRLFPRAVTRIATKAAEHKATALSVELSRVIADNDAAWAKSMCEDGQKCVNPANGQEFTHWGSDKVPHGVPPWTINS